MNIADVFRRVREHGLFLGANYIFGLPTDTRETMQATLDMACELNAEWANFYCAMPYPGSPLYQIAGERGWKRPDDPGGPGWSGYSQHAYESMPLPTETLTYQEVLDFRDEAHLKYFSRREYQAMVFNKFGQTAVDDVNQMLALGKPKRKHREENGDE